MGSISSEMCSLIEVKHEQTIINTSDEEYFMGRTAKVRINVGGVLFKCYTKTLKRFPNTLLSQLDVSSEYYDAIENEYFFDKNPVIFNFILDAYRTGSMHMPVGICGSNFREEILFWGLSEQLVSECCWENLYASDGNVKTIKTLKLFFDTEWCVAEKQSTVRQRLWNFIHEPRSSVYAKVWCLFISFIIVLSVVISGVETVSSARTGTYAEAEKAAIHHIMHRMNIDNASTTFINIYKKPHVLITIIDAFCFFILTTELVLVFCLCPRRMELLRCWQHMSETVCSLAFWFNFICERNLKHIDSPLIIHGMIVCKFLIILKLMRLLRIARKFPALKIMGLTMWVSKNELKMLALMLFILTSLFGTLVYLTECAYNDTFDSMFTGMYWALITLTTVGYGNYVPNTAMGQVVAGTCAVCGVIMLAMPIGIFASNFDSLYSYYQYVSRHIQATRRYEEKRLPGQTQMEEFQCQQTDGMSSVQT